MATNLPKLAEVERLSPRVIRIMGGNPGKFTLQGTNTYLIGRGPRRVLLDTAQGEPTWPSALKRVLESEGATVSKCILSHWHPDHVKGVPDLLRMFPDVPIYKHQPQFMTLDSESWLDFNDGDGFVVDEAKDEVNGTTLRALYCPGHTSDHMAFVLEEEGSMFTGDNVLGHGTAVFDDLSAYISSLVRMREATHFKGRAYPGHGEVVEDGKAKITEYITHRREREKQIIDCMKQDVGKSWGSMEIVKIVYKDVREELHLPAEKGVKLVLDKLQQDGAVKVEGDDDERQKWRLVQSASL